MNSPLRVPFRALSAFGLTAVALPSFAVIATSTDSTPVDTAYRYVGSFNDATSGALYGSGVVVGAHQILTARHVFNVGSFGVANFTLDGVTYHPTALSTPPDYLLSDGTTTKVDVSLVTVTETFAGFYGVGSAAPSPSSSVTMVGYGLGGGVATTASTAGVGSTQSAAAGTYYTTAAAGTRRKGDNTLDTVANAYSGTGPVLESYLKTKGGATLADKDSGGGWFQNGNLIGISDYVFNDTDPVANDADLPYYRDFGFASANTAGYSSSFSPHYTGTPYAFGAGVGYFGSGAINLTDPKIQTWLRSQGVNPVPEPASMLALGLGAAAMLRRRKRR